MIVFLDLDGVVVNFNASVCRLFNVDPIEIEKNWEPKGSYSFEQQLKIAKKDFWKTIHKDKSFWYDLQPYEYVSDLLKIFDGHTVYILTSPSPSSDCWAGKCEFVQKYLPHLYSTLIITKN
jgi:hypothetical protein